MSTENTFDVIVIGAGPGGYVAAIRAAQLGMRVACVEQAKTLGGTCLNVGCIPSKALLESSERFAQTQNHLAEHGIVVESPTFNFGKMMERKANIVERLTKGVAGLFKKNKIVSVQGQASLQDPQTVKVTGPDKETTLKAKRIIIATGSKPIQIPGLKIDQKNILDSTGALAMNEVPKKLAVVGGGYIGLELGSVYARLGSEVWVIEMLDRLIPGMDAEIAKHLQQQLKKQGMQFKFSTKVKQAVVKKAGQVELALSGPESEESFVANAVLVAVGRKPNTEGLGLEKIGVALDKKNRIKVDEHYQTSLSGVYAIGDVITGPMLAHKAMEEGVVLAEHLAGQAAEVHYLSIPSVVYTWPEVAAVGLHEEELKDLKIPFKKFKFPFLANGRALCLGDSDGWVKLLAHPETDRLLGAHIIGPRASDMIAELVLAFAHSSSAEDLAKTVHAHPTLAEAVKEAALGLGDGPIHL